MVSPTYHARTKEDFVKYIKHEILLQKERMKSDLTEKITAKKLTDEDLKRTTWCNPNGKSGVSAMVFVVFGKWKYRLNNNSDRETTLGFLEDIKNSEIHAYSRTLKTGDRIDIANRQSVRTNLFMYREAH